MARFVSSLVKRPASMVLIGLLIGCGSGSAIYTEEPDAVPIFVTDEPLGSVVTYEPDSSDSTQTFEPGN